MNTSTAAKMTIAIVAMSAVSGVWLAPAAYAAKVKDCGTTTVADEPPPSGNAGFTQTQTETQTAACGSNSDQGEVITPGPTTNRGGGTPRGQQ